MMSLEKAKTHTRNSKAPKDVLDFTKIGGLAPHLKTLHEIIILPLMHSNVFSSFNIRAPKGVLFHGPPGTGKTLVAGALANEINRESTAKVSFFQRKGADVLDKWVGESEKKLRELFEKASKSKPSIIFFDELDGLAPKRSQKNDHIHCSLVATLLSLMDGLDNKSGVIVVGATNRIDSIDPALRRPGRFDRELYFPMPTTKGRFEILQVQMRTWKIRPSKLFVQYLAEITAGYSGSDLAALCTEAVLSSIKRNYPITQTNPGKKFKIDADNLRVEEEDFLAAKVNLIPNSIRNRVIRNLSPTVKPLLQKPLEEILHNIESLWPHFMEDDYQYLIGEERYAGRFLIIGSACNGVTSHLVPAILQKLDHLPSRIFDITSVFDDSIGGLTQNFPSVIVFSRLDEWWDLLEEWEQAALVTGVEAIHAGLPILTIATCKTEVPKRLREFFYNNSSVTYNIEPPTEEEKEKFFAPLFFGDFMPSMYRVLNSKCTCKKIKMEECSRTLRQTRSQSRSLNNRNGSKFNLLKNFTIKRKAEDEEDFIKSKRAKLCDLFEEKFNIKNEKVDEKVVKETNSIDDCFAWLLSDLLHPLCKNFDMKMEEMSQGDGEGQEDDSETIYKLWKRVSLVTTKNMNVAQLELFYDVICACLNINKSSFRMLVANLKYCCAKVEMRNKTCKL